MQFFPDTSLPDLKNKIFIYSDTFAVSKHATQLAQIMAGGSGLGQNKSAMDIAPKAQIHAHDIIDYRSQVRTAAFAGMNISLHAYDQDYGWSRSNYPFWGGLEAIDSLEDFHWGRYNAESAWWDSLTYAYPQLLVVKSAGNSNGNYFSGQHYLYEAYGNASGKILYRLIPSKKERAVDGGLASFDCLAPMAVAKNILTVGAVELLNGQYQLVANSSVGPTDDGRVKPDVVAYGEQTSQSAAAVAGGAALLRQNFKMNFNQEPPAHLLKNFIISGAQDLDTVLGPNYRSGWGLVNLKASLALTAAKYWRVINLARLDTFKGEILITDDTCKITIVWQDAAAVPSPFSLNSTMLNNRQPALVNQVDLAVQALTQPKEVYRPFCLSSRHPAKAAYTGLNQIDNVEQVLILNGETEIMEVVIKAGELKAERVPVSIVLKGGVLL
jgi:hypothetical protein